MKKTRNRIIAIMTSLVMVLSVLMPYGQYVANAQTQGDNETITVYFTLSEDGKFVTGNDEEETILCHVPVEISYFDLADYGLEDYYRYESDPFEEGGGYNSDTVIERPTVLHLYIKMLEKYYLGGEKLETSTDALSIEGGATHLYMKQFWGHDENLMYFVDHKYPLQAAGWGSTCDYILLEDGMEIDVAMYTDWNFYHTGAFAAFESETEKINGAYNIGTGEDITLFMGGTATSSSVEGETAFVGEPMTGEKVCVTRAENAFADNSNDKWPLLEQVTDSRGNITLSFDEPGTYYVSSNPFYETYQMESGNACVAPPIAVINVTGQDGTEEDLEDYSGRIIENIQFAGGITDDAPIYTLNGNEVLVPDYAKNLYAKVKTERNAPSRCIISGEYDGKSVAIAKGGLGTKLSGLISQGHGGNEFAIRAICQNQNIPNIEEQSTYTIKRIATLSKLNVDGLEAFNPEKTQYQISVMEDATQLSIDAKAFLDSSQILIDGQPLVGGKVDISGKESINIEVVAENCQSRIYTINISWKQYGKQEFNTTPGSVLVIRDSDNNVIETKACEGETYLINGLTIGSQYSYTVTCPGYVSKNQTFTCLENGLAIDARMEKAPLNETIIDKPALWPNFRGNDENNGVVNGLTPTSHQNAQLYWAVKAGYSYGTGAPSSPILVDGNLIYTTATTIVKMDTISGEILQTGKMVKTSAFNITPPTYADGMIFVALASGTIQAFNADTLESLWVYHDPYWGQPNCPITYCDGYIYTGFWNGEEKNANFVCLSASDEDPLNTTEEKVATWTLKHKGGFYWAGAYACKDFVAIGGDDGAPSTADGKGILYILDPKTGKILDKSDQFVGDIRSTICYDKVGQKYYFTTKGGYLYGVTISEEGTIGPITWADLGGQSTSTPVIYNGRAYVGIRGEEMFGVNTGHGIGVVNLETMTLAYKLRTRGYPQTSGVLSAGYDDGYVYVYFIDNYEPGKLRILKDQPGQTQPIILRESDYEDDDDVNVIFTPKGEHANYAICSPIVDEYGTMYFKNDSSFMMAVGSKVTKIRVTSMPEKTCYEEGESFNPEGIKVMAYYANGLSRDITGYVEYNKTNLTADDTDIEVSFPYISYNDELKNYEKFDKLYDVINITVGKASDSHSAGQVEDMINSLPENITLDSKDAIIQARDAFNGLSFAAMGMVSNIAKLDNAEKAYNDLIQEALANTQITIKLIKDEKGLALSWNENPYAKSYTVYLYDNLRGKYFEVGNTQQCSFSLHDLEIGSSLQLKVVPVAGGINGGIVAGEGTQFSQSITGGKAALTSAISKGYNSAKISWSPLLLAKGYTIYVSTKKNSGFKAKKTVLGGEVKNATITGLITGKTYYFKVKAFALDGTSKVYSQYSPVKYCKAALAKPTITVKKTKKVKTIKIKKVAGASGYYIYRSTKKTSGYKLVMKSKKLVNYDRKIKNNKVYYKVKAYRIVNGKKVFSAYSTVK